MSLLDVNPALFYSEEHHLDYIENIESSVTSITLPDWTCNDTDYTTFDFSRFEQLEFLSIGDDSFGSVKIFKIEGLEKLKRIVIGVNSFTKEKNDYDSDESKIFHVLNCESLESIKIGEYSFSDFGGQFELENLPMLQSIEIGTIGVKSFNFCDCSFILKGLLCFLRFDLDLPSLTTITLGDIAFGYAVLMAIEGNAALYCLRLQIYLCYSLLILVNVLLLEDMKTIPAH